MVKISTGQKFDLIVPHFLFVLIDWILFIIVLGNNAYVPIFLVENSTIAIFPLDLLILWRPSYVVPIFQRFVQNVFVKSFSEYFLISLGQLVLSSFPNEEMTSDEFTGIYTIIFDQLLSIWWSLIWLPSIYIFCFCFVAIFYALMTDQTWCQTKIQTNLGILK